MDSDGVEERGCFGSVVKVHFVEVKRFQDRIGERFEFLDKVLIKLDVWFLGIRERLLAPDLQNMIDILPFQIKHFISHLTLPRTILLLLLRKLKSLQAKHPELKVRGKAQHIILILLKQPQLSRV